MRNKVFQQILADTPKDVAIFVEWYADLVLRIQQLLNEKKISQKQLALKLDKSPSEISKWLNGEHNFTLRSLAKLSAELGEPLLEVPRKPAIPAYTDSGYTVKYHTFVSVRKFEPVTASPVWQLGETPMENELSYAG
jgi:transcriptional regulator with XRE-family HTH domain